MEKEPVLGGAQKAEVDRDKAAASLLQVLEMTPENVLESRLYSQAEACTLLGKDPKTLTKARAERNAKGPNVHSINPLDLASIHFVTVDKVDSYPAIELLNYIKRRKFARRLSISAQADPKKYAENIRPTTLLGFQTWLGTASVKDTWPFCIQPSGRPVDFVAALVFGQTTDDIRWLTIREFATMAADTAACEHVSVEQTVVADVTRIPESKSPAQQEAAKKKRRV
jgi:hypothetical protein